VLICKRLEDLPALDTPLHLALGVFDGVHIGHQAVIDRAVQAAAREGGMAGLLTFDPHPIRVIAPDKAPSALLETLDHKARLVATLGVELLIPLHFDQELANMDAAEFIQKLTSAPVRTIAVGEDWRFGKNRTGDLAFLKKKAAELGFKLEAVAPVMLDGERVSSTRIRNAIRAGNLMHAEKMLGHPYLVCGSVVEGQKLGRTLGFPTANLGYGDAQLPPDGVWAVQARLQNGTLLQGVANLGNRPTLANAGRALEIHLMDFSGDLYGQFLEVHFIKHLRDEWKFPSIDALRTQIQQDTNLAANVLNSLKFL
jgi:riboflavin kinase/FMN adenylyltransferase